MTYLLTLLYSLCKKESIRRFIIKVIAKLEGGEMNSDTIRQLLKKYHNVEIGKHSYGCFNFQNIRPGATIGRYCSFGRNVMVFDANHPIHFISTHPYFYEPSYGIVDKFLATPVPTIIENDVWIGHNALILPNVKRIGNGAIIGAAAVVTKDVPDYAIVAGNPAKVIRYRFDEATIQSLLEEQWWLKEPADIRENIDHYTKDLAH